MRKMMLTMAKGMRGFCAAPAVAMTLVTISLLLASGGVAQAEQKPHVKEVKVLDAKAIEDMVYDAHEGSSQLDPEIYDNRALELTVDCGKEKGLTLLFYWYGTRLGENGKDHVRAFWSQEDLAADEKGMATVKTKVAHFVKGPEGAKQEKEAYTFDGWVAFVMSPKGSWITYKTSSSAMDKVVKEEQKKLAEKKKEDEKKK